MFAAFGKAVAQCSDPAFRRVLLRALGAALVLFALLWTGAWFLLSWAGEGLSEWAASADLGDFLTGILEWLFGVVSVSGVVVASLFVFPAATALILSFLVDDVALAVEQRHYPELPAARDQPVMESVRDALGFTGITLLANLIALPFYFIPPFNLFVFYALNGYLLGREYFELVAVRRLESAAARQLRKRYRGRVLMAGVIIAFFLTLPLINLVTPIIATAFMLHVFEAVRRRGDVLEGAAG